MALSKFGKGFAFRGYEYETCNSAAKRIRNDGEHVFGFPHILQLAEYKVNEFSASFSSYSAHPSALPSISRSTFKFNEVGKILRTSSLDGIHLIVVFRISDFVSY